MQGDAEDARGRIALLIRPERIGQVLDRDLATARTDDRLEELKRPFRRLPGKWLVVLRLQRKAPQSPDPDPPGPICRIGGGRLEQARLIVHARSLKEGMAKYGRI